MPVWCSTLAKKGRSYERNQYFPRSTDRAVHDFADPPEAQAESADHDVWLNSGNTEAVLKLLRPFNGQMRGFPVSTRVNFVQNDDPECATPACIFTNSL
jgi:hypothetical protein